MKQITALFLLLIAGSCFAQETATLEQRFAFLVEKLEAKRVEYHIPGMALAVVLDDKIVLERSFGVSNMEEELAVTADTLFAIGSVTKSFTSAAIGVLVDEGKMDFDAPITRYLPPMAISATCRRKTDRYGPMTAFQWIGNSATVRAKRSRTSPRR